MSGCHNGQETTRAGKKKRSLDTWRPRGGKKREVRACFAPRPERSRSQSRGQSSNRTRRRSGGGAARGPRAPVAKGRPREGESKGGQRCNERA